MLPSTLQAEDIIETNLNCFDVGKSSESHLERFGEDIDTFYNDTSLDLSVVEIIEQRSSACTLLENLIFKTNYVYKEHKVKANKFGSEGIEYSEFNQAQISTYLQFDTKLSNAWKIQIFGDTFYDMNS